MAPAPPLDDEDSDEWGELGGLVLPPRFNPSGAGTGHSQIQAWTVEPSLIGTLLPGKLGRWGLDPPHQPLSPPWPGSFWGHTTEDGRRPMNNSTEPKQNRTTETRGLDEGLKETLLKEAGEIMLDQLYDKMACEGGPIPAR
jgi:hypothetical protein